MLSLETGPVPCNEKAETKRTVGPPAAPSPEQQAVLTAFLSGHPTVVVHALAGTGKTTCLLHLARSAERGSVLYLAFNRCAQQEAARRFGTFAVCRTFHALALEQLRARGPVWVQKLAAVRADTLSCVRAALPPSCFSSHTVRGVAEEISAFCWSRSQDTHRLSPPASTAWNALTSSLLPSVPMSHEVYLKLWSLSGPDLGGYQHIFLDEAQDANSAVLAALESAQQQGAQVVLVGDPNQALYRFQGTCDFLAEWGRRPGAVILPLSVCYRCGPAVAAVANSLLHQGSLPHQGSLLQAAGPASAAVLRGQRTDGLQSISSSGGRWAVLCRTNIQVGQFLQLARAKGWSATGLHRRDFRMGEAETLPTLPPDSSVSVVVGTVHSAKGLEFDNVYIAHWGEMIAAARREQMEKKQCSDSTMVAYVACTRAKHVLFLEVSGKTRGAKRQKKNWSWKKQKEKKRTRN